MTKLCERVVHLAIYVGLCWALFLLLQMAYKHNTMVSSILPQKINGNVQVNVTMPPTKVGKFENHLPKVNFNSIEAPEKVGFYYKGKFPNIEDRKTKTILLYTNHFGSATWPGLAPSVLGKHFENAGCRIKECRLTYDKKEIKTADVAFFHGCDLHSYEHYKNSLTPLRPAHQKWLFWMHETPLIWPLKDSYDNMFNWTMSFTRQASIFNGYFSYRRLTNDDQVPNSATNFASLKEGKVVWMVSRCTHTSRQLRMEYVTELQHHTDVTVYGKCGSHFNNNGGIIKGGIEKVIQKFKFYLAFENSFCQDYITEKYFRNGLMYGAVPIVMGANYDRSNSIPGSYIDVQDFSSIKELGDYINYLDLHDEEYNKYFRWTRHFKPYDGLDKLCLVCHAAHDLSRGKSILTDFRGFYSTDSMCKPFDHVKQKLQDQVDKSKAERLKKAS